MIKILDDAPADGSLDTKPIHFPWYSQISGLFDAYRKKIQTTHTFRMFYFESANAQTSLIQESTPWKMGLLIYFDDGFRKTYQTSSSRY